MQIYLSVACCTIQAAYPSPRQSRLTRDLSCSLSAVCDLGRAAVHPAAHTQCLLPRALSRHPGWYAARYSFAAIAHAAVWSTPILWHRPLRAGFRPKRGESQRIDSQHDISAKCTYCLMELALCLDIGQVVWI